MMYGLQCLICRHIEAPAEDLYQCQRCGSFEVHIFPVTVVESDAAEVDVSALLEAVSLARVD